MSFDVDTSDMASDALPVTRILPRALTRVLSWALVGVLGGFLVGFLMSNYTCRDGLIYNCYPIQGLKIGLLAAAVSWLASSPRASLDP